MDDEAAGQTGNLPAEQPEPVAPGTICIRGYPGETEQQSRARVLLESDLNAALTIQRVAPSILAIEITPLLDELAKQSGAVDLKRGEAMLANQAATLDALFHTLTRRAMANAESNIGATESFMRLALKAQSQARSCWDSIGELRHPRTVAFVRADQANIAAGHQQVNNARGESEIPPNELNGVGHGAMDSRSTTPAIGVDPAMAAVAAIDGATITRGQGKGSAERIQGKRARAAAPSRKATARG